MVGTGCFSLRILHDLSREGPRTIHVAGSGALAAGGDWCEVPLAFNGHMFGVLPFLLGTGQHHHLGEHVLAQHLLFEGPGSRAWLALLPILELQPGRLFLFQVGNTPWICEGDGGWVDPVGAG